MSRAQGDLFERRVYPDAPGHRGVDTSIAAADAIAPHVSRLNRSILDYLATRAGGAIRDEICDACRITTQTACGRLRELELNGRVRKGPTRAGKSGHQCHTYLLVP